MKTHLFFASIVVLAALLLSSTSAHAQMSDTEKKAAARAAYQEGVKLQDEGKPAEALGRFESAQKLFDAPTHLLHIAECQALTGRLVEASETYETLARKSMPPGSPEAFVQAQNQGQAELPALRARIPTLRVTIKPGPQQVQSLTVNVNGVGMPNELLGIARPLNPGTYRFSAQAVGWSTPRYLDVPLAEKEQKSVELTMTQGPAGPAVVVPPPQGAPPGGAPPPYAGNNRDDTKPKALYGPSTTGLVFGIRGGASVPGGQYSDKEAIKNHATAGGAFGIDAYLRLVKVLLLGATFEYAGLGTPSERSDVPLKQTVTTSAHATYIGVNLGILPSPDHVSFIGDVGLGSRTLADSISGLPTGEVNKSASGLEFALGAGLSLPAGPIRLVPRVNLGVGSFSSNSDTAAVVTSPLDSSSNRGTHTFFFIGLAAYYSLDLSAKTE